MLKFILWYYGVGIAIGLLMDIGAGAYLAHCIQKAGFKEDEVEAIANRIIENLANYISLDQYFQNLSPGMCALLSIIGHILLPILFQVMIYNTIKAGDHLVAEAKKAES